jgi:hypothetical protein
MSLHCCETCHEKNFLIFNHLIFAIIPILSWASVENDFGYHLVAFFRFLGTLSVGENKMQTHFPQSNELRCCDAYIEVILHDMRDFSKGLGCENQRGEEA